MTKRHFIAIAARFREAIKRPEKDEAEVYALEQMARELCDTFKQFNPNFDRGRFLAACGVEDTGGGGFFR